MSKIHIRVCPVCSRTIRTGLWQHFWTVHKDCGWTDKEFVQHLLGLEEIPKCLCCGRDTAVKYDSYEFTTYCCKQCQCKAIRAEIRECPECHIKLKGGFWLHREYAHPDIPEEEFLRRYLGLKEVPTCANPNCNNIKIDYGHFKFQTFCSRTCKFQTQNNLLDWMNNHREQHDAQFAKA